MTLIGELFAVVQVLILVGACLWFYRMGKRDAIRELFENSEVPPRTLPDPPNGIQGVERGGCGATSLGGTDQR